MLCCLHFDRWSGSFTRIFYPVFANVLIIQNSGIKEPCPKNSRWLGTLTSVQFSPVAQSCPTLCDPMDYSTPGLPVHHQLPKFTQTYAHWVGDVIHPTISSSVIPFSSCLQSFQASASFPMSQFCASGGQNIGVSALVSVLPVNIQDWFPLGWTGWISLLSKGLSGVFSKTTVQEHQFFGTQLSL